MQEFIFLFRMFLYVDVLEVVIQSVQLLFFLGLSTVRLGQSHARLGRGVGPTPLKVCTLGAEGNRGGIFCVSSEAQRCEPAQCSDGVSCFLPSSSHEETLQLVRVYLLP